MFTTGSKLLIGSTIAAIAAAIVYGVTQEGTLGTIGLVSAAVALAILTTINLLVRDSNVDAADANAVATSAAARRAPGNSAWPIVGALGVASMGLGLVAYQAFTVIGIGLVLLALVEWTVQAWAERGSADAAFNEDLRQRVANPLEVPILAAGAAAIIVYSFSRVMLSLTKTGTVVAFSVVAVLLLAVGFLYAKRPKASTGAITGLAAIAGLALVAGGTVAGLSGEREMHVHETTEDLGERGRCGVEETEADEKASQTVSAKSNVSATVILSADGQLSYTVPGYPDGSAALVLPRSNPNNVLFRNESPEHRRLVLEGVPVGDGTESKTFCTALVEEGAVQLLTLIFPKPTSIVEGGLAFTVPGVDTAQLEVVVP
jgi:hypothetical protein